MVVQLPGYTYRDLFAPVAHTKSVLSTAKWMFSRVLICIKTRDIGCATKGPGVQSHLPLSLRSSWFVPSVQKRLLVGELQIGSSFRSFICGTQISKFQYLTLEVFSFANTFTEFIA